MMPSTMIRTTRHDASRQVAFASCAAGEISCQLPDPLRSTASLADPWISIPPMMPNPGCYDYDYDYGRNYVTLRYVTVSGPRLLVTQLPCSTAGPPSRNPCVRGRAVRWTAAGVGVPAIARRCESVCTHVVLVSRRPSGSGFLG